MKKNTQTALLAIRPNNYQGEQVLQKLWPDFMQAFKNLLGQVGIEASDSNQELLLFVYDHPYSALTSFFESLDLMKKQKWKKEWGPLPVFVVMHIQKKGDPPAAFREANASVWGVMQPEIPYVTRTLKVQWEQFFAGKKLPEYSFTDAEGGLFLLKFTGDISAIKQERLFSNRYLASQGTNKECFYCGMTSHTPATCPSKLMTLETRGIHLVGYHPFATVNSLFQKVMTQQKKLTELLATNVTPAQIRKDPALQVFLAYFDLYLIFQPRFLGYIAFSVHPSWDGTAKVDRVKIDSHHLNTGLDCLRVGQHKEAFEHLMAESQSLAGKQFYATIGQAFVALERGRWGDMAQFLQMAASQAGTEKEKIYISLLLSRYHSLAGHTWKSEQVVQAVANLFVDCQEVTYRRIQSMVAEGNGQQALQLLRKLAGTDRQYFVAALMDPALLPVSGMVENLLASLLQTKIKQAKENLSGAQSDYAELKNWFGEEDEELTTNLAVLENLEKQYERKSLYDVLDVAERAKALSMASPRLREAKLDQLNEWVDEAAITWTKFSDFWVGYPYKSFFREFVSTLQIAKRKLVEARSIAGESLVEAKNRLESGKGYINTLKIILGRMQKLKLALDTLKMFLRKLIKMELVFTGLAVLMFPLITILLRDMIPPDIVMMARDPRIQKNCIFITNLLVAPFFALAFTIRGMGGR